MIDEMKKKLFPSVSSLKISYILALYFVIKELFRDMNDISLVNITYEATEIGIIRDGTFHYSTHIPFGSFSLAREISEITSVPLYEAFGYLHGETPYSFMEPLPSNQREAIETVFESYIERLTELFQETGDDLSIPKRIFLHADLMSEPLFSDLIEKAAKRSIKTEPHIQMITPFITNMMLEKNGPDETLTSGDTAMLVSAYFFHKHPEWDTPEYL
jgi:Tfp pilus assembly PilM family ATPase